MANYTSTSASTWYKIDSTNDNQFNWKYATDVVYGNSSVTYTTKVCTSNAEEDEMAASQSKAPVLHGLINAGLLGKSLETLVIATSTQVGKYLPNAGYCRVNLTAGTDPLSPNRNQWSQAQAHSIVLILYRIDDTDDPVRKANIVREALTALHQNYVKNAATGNKMPPQVVIFSGKSSAEELIDIAMYAGANWAEEAKFDGIEGVCVITSLLERY